MWGGRRTGREKKGRRGEVTSITELCYSSFSPPPDIDKNAQRINTFIARNEKRGRKQGTEWNGVGEEKDVSE